MRMLISIRSTGRRSTCWTVALAAALVASSAFGQVGPSASGRRHTLWVGGEYSNISASFPYSGRQRLWGLGGFADCTVMRYLGIEAEGRYLLTNGFYDEHQENYLVGPQFIVGRSQSIQPFAQFLVGAGRLTYPLQTASGISFVLEPGGGINFLVRDRWIVRGEYEYQRWPGSSNISGQPRPELTPNGVHVGIAFKLLR
jgi:opacity protein-like surface antigen